MPLCLDPIQVRFSKPSPNQANRTFLKIFSVHIDSQQIPLSLDACLPVGRREGGGEGDTICNF